MPVSIGRYDSESKNSSRGGTRTPDPVINSHLLYQLSYSGKHVNCNDLQRRLQPRGITSYPLVIPRPGGPFDACKVAGGNDGSSAPQRQSGLGTTTDYLW